MEAKGPANLLGGQKSPFLALGWEWGRDFGRYLRLPERGVQALGSPSEMAGKSEDCEVGGAVHRSWVCGKLDGSRSYCQTLTFSLPGVGAVGRVRIALGGKAS